LRVQKILLSRNYGAIDGEFDHMRMRMLSHDANRRRANGNLLEQTPR
jgi:hypothetical protein